MNSKIIKYYSGELSSDERKSFYQEVLTNEDLKKEMIAYRHLDVLMKLHLKKEDKQANKESLDNFLQTRRKNHAKRLINRSFFKVAAFLVCILSTWWITQVTVSTDVLPPVAQELTVPAGQRAHILLSDGSSVWVNAGSTLRYPSIFGEERRVTLTGEAFFNVAKGEDPFIVSTGKTDIRALGTQFNVYNYPSENLIVSLLEGSVNVYRTGNEQKGAILTPNQQLTEMDGHFVVTTITHNPIDWKDGIYSFEGQPIENILKKLELYHGVQLTVKNLPFLQDCITVKFRQHDGVMEVLRIIQKLHPFRIQKVEDSNEIILYR